MLETAEEAPSADTVPASDCERLSHNVTTPFSAPVAYTSPSGCNAPVVNGAPPADSFPIDTRHVSLPLPTSCMHQDDGVELYRYFEKPPDGCIWMDKTPACLIVETQVLRSTSHSRTVPSTLDAVRHLLEAPRLAMDVIFFVCPPSLSVVSVLSPRPYPPRVPSRQLPPSARRGHQLADMPPGQECRRPPFLLSCGAYDPLSVYLPISATEARDAEISRFFLELMRAFDVLSKSSETCAREAW